MHDVDIIIPLYNKASTVVRTIDSIRAQTVTNWRLWVVDDGSTDDSAKRVADINDRRITLIRQTNQGIGAARNTGIARATSEILAFLDADDEWYPWYLENALTALKNNNVSMAASLYYRWPRQEDMTSHFEQLGIKAGRYEITGREDPVWFSDIMSFISAWNTVVRTDILRHYGGFYDKNHCCWGEDQILFIRIALNEPFMVIGPPAVRYHTETSSFSYDRQSNSPRLRLLSPLLQEESLLRDYCPPEKQEMLQGFFERAALATATNWAYYGRRKEAQELLKKYPHARRFKKIYRHYLWYGRIRPFWWARFKLWIGPPIRAKLRAWAIKLGLTTAPPTMASDTIMDKNHGGN